MKDDSKLTNSSILIDPAVRFGKPCLAGTRVAVSDICNFIQRGYTVNDVSQQYEGVSVEQALEAIVYAKTNPV